MGYRLPETQEQCEGIAKHLKLADTQALTHGLDCPVGRNSRCVYDRNQLLWSPKCADGSDINDLSENLCILDGN